MAPNENDQERRRRNKIRELQCYLPFMRNIVRCILSRNGENERRIRPRNRLLRIYLILNNEIHLSLNQLHKMERFLKIIYRIFKDKFQGEIPQNAQQRSDCQPSTSTEGQSPRCNDEGSGSTRPSSHDPREEDRTETRMDSESRIVHEPDFDPDLMPRFTDPTEKYYEKPKNE